MQRDAWTRREAPRFTLRRSPALVIRRSGMDRFASIDTQISQYEQQILKLKRRRNGITGFCHLSREVVVYILRLVQRSSDAETDSFANQIWQPFSNRWILVANSCSHLREIALQERELWSAIDVTFMYRGTTIWRDLCLERAGETSLTIRAVGSLDSARGDIFLSEHLCRARAVHVEPYDNLTVAARNAIRAAFNFSAPFLTFIEFIGEIALTPKFLGGSCRYLQTLKLSHAKLGKTAPLPRLRHLVID
jgi:hypothetical protein